MFNKCELLMTPSHLMIIRTSTLFSPILNLREWMLLPFSMTKVLQNETVKRIFFVVQRSEHWWTYFSTSIVPIRLSMMSIIYLEKKKTVHISCKFCSYCFSQIINDRPPSVMFVESYRPTLQHIYEGKNTNIQILLMQTHSCFHQWIPFLNIFHQSWIKTLHY